MDRIIENAYAKINIFLEVLGRRGDGFHDIETVMQTVSLCDEVALTFGGDGISLSCRGIDLPPESNLAYAAAAAYAGRAGIGLDCTIEVIKRIPSGAGLGGGSADAAAVLRALEKRYRKLGLKELLKLAAELGSDVPFCVTGGCALARGRGEVLSPLPSIPDCFIVICAGDDFVSTADAYAALDALPFAVREDTVAPAVAAGDLEGICRGAFNRFGETASYAKKQISAFAAAGAKCALLTGSGNAVAGIFTDGDKAREAAKRQTDEGCGAWVCAPVEKEEI